MDETDENPVWQNANDVICKTTEEFSYWISKFYEAGKPEQAVILEAQHLALHS